MLQRTCFSYRTMLQKDLKLANKAVNAGSAMGRIQERLTHLHAVKEIMEHNGQDTQRLRNEILYHKHQVKRCKAILLRFQERFGDLMEEAVLQ